MEQRIPPLKLLIKYLNKNNVLFSLTLIIWLFIIYSELPLPIGRGVSLPCIFLLLLIPIYYPILLKKINLTHIILFLSIIGIGVLSIVSKADIELLKNSILKILQFAYSILIFIITLIIFSHAGKNLTSKLIGTFIVAILIGTLLERLGILRPLTEAFRIVYAETKGGSEISSDREYELAGFARPYFFTAEPSLVGLGYFSLISCYSFINRDIKYDILLIISIVPMLALLGSPTVLLSLIPILIFLPIKYNINLLKSIQIISIVVISIVLLTQINIVYDIYSRVTSRLTTEIFEERSSMYGRIFVPFFITLPKILPMHPVFGIGLGNYGFINEAFGYRADYDEFDTLFFHGSNGFVTMLIYLGIFGTLLLYILIRWFQKQNSIPFWIMTIIFFITSGQITGSVSTPRFWAFTGLAMACLYLGKQKSARENEI